MSAGLDPALYWSLTFVEIDAILMGSADRLRHEQNGRAWAAWHAAYLTAYAPAKPQKFPKLEKLMQQSDTARRTRKTPTEMKAVFATWAGKRAPRG